MKRLIFMTMAALATTAVSAQGLQYPKAAKDGTVDEYFGTKVADPYRWLENDTSAQTAAWVEAENKVTNAYLQKIPFRGKLLAEEADRTGQLREDLGAKEASRQVVLLQEQRPAEPERDVRNGRAGR